MNKNIHHWIEHRAKWKFPVIEIEKHRKKYRKSQIAIRSDNSLSKRLIIDNYSCTITDISEMNRWNNWNSTNYISKSQCEYIFVPKTALNSVYFQRAWTLHLS